jgi:DNA-binding MarR family transcriptional regulator
MDVAMKSKNADTTLVLNELRRLVKALREGARTAEQTRGLSGAQLFVMQALAEVPSLSLNQLAERTQTHQSSVSVVVGRLVRRRLVQRGQAKDDARRLVLRLTARGERLLEASPPAAQDRLISAVKQLPASQRRALGSILTRIAELMDLPSGTPAMFFEERPG